MKEESGFARSDYEQVPQELEGDFQKIQEIKTELAGLVGKFSQKEPGILQALYAAFKGFELHARADLYREHVKSRRDEIVELAHDNALEMEEKHKALQANAVNAIAELTSFEKDELGRQGETHEVT
jgi:hypothetical protein